MLSIYYLRKNRFTLIMSEPILVKTEINTEIEIKSEPESFLDEDQFDQEEQDLELDAPDFVHVEDSKTVEAGHLRCSECSKVFAEPLLLNFHFEIHRQASNKSCTCHHCGKVFETARQFKRHIENHLKQYAKCAYCHQNFFGSKTYIAHVALHKKKERLYSCSFCDKKFFTNKEQYIHERVHTNERPYVCSICKKGFKQGGPLKMHLNNVHNERKDFQCGICQGYFSTGSSLNRHTKQIHEQGRTIPCKICSAVFYNYDAFQKHKTDQHLENRYFKVCPVCEKPFFSKSQYISHSKTHPDYGEKLKERNLAKRYLIFKESPLDADKVNIESTKNEYVKDVKNKEIILEDTPENQKEQSNSVKKRPAKRKKTSLRPRKKKVKYEDTSNAQDLNLLNKTAESIEEANKIPEIKKEQPDQESESSSSNSKDKTKSELKCSFCEESFPTEEIRGIHYIIHTMDGKKRVKCPACAKMFIRHSHFKKHIKEHMDRKWQIIENKLPKLEPQTPSLPVNCGDCGEEFPCQEILDFHKTAHTIQTLYNCQFCMKKYIHLNHYKNHIAKHIEQSITCQHCSKVFFMKRDYIRHVKVHTMKSKEAATCRFCRIVFSRASSRNTHEFTVHGVKGKFKCIRCSKSFQQWHYFNLHLKYVYSCSVCDAKFCRVEDMRRHTVAEHQNVYNKLQCKKCVKYFENQREYRLHFLENHSKSFSKDVSIEADETNASNYSQTGSGSESAISIKTEIDSVSESAVSDTGETSIGYKCDQCGKKFCRIIYFRKHLLNHALFKKNDS